MLIPRQLPSQQQGVGLLEVLVTALVLAVGLLGMAVLQIKSTQFNQSAYIRSQANILAYDIADRMRANPKVSYNIAVGTAAPTGTALVDIDLNQWKNQLSGSLPAGKGSISCVASATSTNLDVCTITVFWRESSQAPTEPDISLTYSTRI
jgi:type IV pilus assembly protein PilV